MKIINKKAYHNYEILDKITAGVKLTGAEVKSVRDHHFELSDSFVKIQEAEAYLVNAHIHPYLYADNREYDPKRKRKLLLNKKEILTLKTKIAQSGLTLVPVSVYNSGNLIKVEIALAKGKKKWDKRRNIKERDMSRQEEELFRGRS